MSWRFRRVISAGLVRFNLSRLGVGWSFGVPGLRYGRSAIGRRYLSVGFPGLGLYWMKYLDPDPISRSRASIPTVVEADRLRQQEWRQLR